VVPRPNNAGTFTTRAGTIENAESPLQPFYQAPGKFWTSNGVRDTRTLGYTYPELAQWSSLSPQEKSVRIHTEVNRLYGKTAPVAGVKPRVFGAVSAPKEAAAAPVPPAAAPPKPETPSAKPQTPAAAAPVPAGTAQKVLATTPAPAAPAAGKAPAAKPPAKPAAKHDTKHTAPHKHDPAAPHKHDPAAPHKHDHKKEEGAVEITGTSNVDEPDWHETATTADDKVHYHEWVANIRVEKYAVKSTFFVHVFLGDFTNDPAGWGEDPNLVGSHVIFANNANFTGCQNCLAANEARKLVTGTIPLTGALGDKLGAEKLAHLEPELVGPYLKANLHWRIQKHDNTVIERSEIPSLKISVGHALVEVPESVADFPSWGKIHINLGVTTGRPGGADEED